MLRVSLLLFLLLSFLPGTTHAQYWAEHHPTGPLYPFNTIDFDSDGDIDIIAVGGGVYVIENNLPDPWQEYEHDIPDLWATTSFITDFGADGDLDYAYYSGGVTYGALGWV
ncbi:MAG TPA: hypothetical protein ENH10_00035, partial [Bacteroidetes bacterium]|nr:hypothetical protein [Bacteroidota bacterium]HEX03534.1 hypothetical protein [Bacteroidota bacterium]